MPPSNVRTLLIHTAAALASLTVALVLMSSFAVGAHADVPAGQTIANPLKYNTLDALLTAVLKAAIQIGSIVLTLAIVFVGFRFVAARGNEEKIRSARTALMWTIIGGLILLGATAIQSVITSTVSNITT